MGVNPNILTISSTFQGRKWWYQSGTLLGGNFGDPLFRIMPDFCFILYILSVKKYYWFFIGVMRVSIRGSFMILVVGEGSIQSFIIKYDTNCIFFSSIPITRLRMYPIIPTWLRGLWGGGDVGFCLIFLDLLR